MRLLFVIYIFFSVQISSASVGSYSFGLEKISCFSLFDAQLSTGFFSFELTGEKQMAAELSTKRARKKRMTDQDREKVGEWLREIVASEQFNVYLMINFVERNMPGGLTFYASPESIIAYLQNIFMRAGENDLTARELNFLFKLSRETDDIALMDPEVLSAAVFSAFGALQIHVSQINKGLPFDVEAGNRLVMDVTRLNIENLPEEMNQTLDYLLQRPEYESAVDSINDIYINQFLKGADSPKTIH